MVIKTGHLLGEKNMRKFKVKLKRFGELEYETNDAGLLILRCIRQKDHTAVTEPCPFCHKKAHYHGIGNGHKVAHCAGDFKINLPDGECLYSGSGYVLREVSNF